MYVICRADYLLVAQGILISFKELNRTSYIENQRDWKFERARLFEPFNFKKLQLTKVVFLMVSCLDTDERIEETAVLTKSWWLKRK